MFINYLSTTIIFILGLCIGSFLNCYIYRLEENKSLKGRSFCPHCKHTLNWLDLFPVFSFLFLGGKCRYCKKVISWQYPLVELITGILFVLISNLVISNWTLNSNFKFQISNYLELVFLFYISSALIIIFIYDLKHYIIPDKVLFPAITVAFCFRILEFFNLKFVSDFGFRASDFNNLFSYLLAIIIASGFFLAIFLLSKGRAMGFGDVKLAILMGLLLGLPNVLTALFLAFFFGAIIGVALMAFEKKGLKSEIPFGPFLITGTFISLLYGNQLIQWYLNFFQI